MSHSGIRNKRVLGRRPTINYVSPPVQDDFDIPSPEPEVSEEATRIENRIARAVAIRNGYRTVEQLADSAQEALDIRAGDFVAKLDSRVDAQAIAAIKRQFPEKDPNQITYEMYKEAIGTLQNEGLKRSQTITPEDLKQAQTKSVKDVLAGLGIRSTGVPTTAPDAPLSGSADNTIPVGTGVFNLPGSLRPELGTIGNPIEPIDLDSFQTEAIKQLVDLIKPLLKTFIIDTAKAALKPF